MSWKPIEFVSVTYFISMVHQHSSPKANRTHVFLTSLEQHKCAYTERGVQSGPSAMQLNSLDSSSVPSSPLVILSAALTRLVLPDQIWQQSVLPGHHQHHGLELLRAGEFVVNVA